MSDSLMTEGLNLMAFGMGTVFVFLAILVVATTVMSRVAQRFTPPAPATPAKAAPKSGQPTAAGDDQLMAVISTAVHKYRSRHK